MFVYYGPEVGIYCRFVRTAGFHVIRCNIY